MENNMYKPESKENSMKWSITNYTVKIIFQGYWSMFYKKTPTTIYFNVSLLIQCNACRFFVIICDIY